MGFYCDQNHLSHGISREGSKHCPGFYLLRAALKNIPPPKARSSPATPKGPTLSGAPVSGSVDGNSMVAVGVGMGIGV